MLTVEQMEQKVKELAAQIEQSAANHHILIGSKLTWEALLAEAKTAATVVAQVDPNLAPQAQAVETAVAAVENVIN